VVRLHLESRVHMGDDPRCADGLDLACEWQTPPRAGPAPTRRGVIWRRGEITLPNPMRKLSRLAMLVQNVGCGFEVFVNGHRNGSSGSMRWGEAGRPVDGRNSGESIDRFGSYAGFRLGDCLTRSN
jgi:hypothetical protein